MLVKKIASWSWDWSEPQAVIVKMGHRGLRGADREAFLKRATDTANIFLDRLEKVAWQPGEVPVHLIALGAYEAYGPNRNGDAFRETALQKYHDTFLKARVYRSHANTDPAKSYGVIKASAYNPTMRRVELLVGLNGDEKAAKANGGLVADRELEKLATGQDLPFSMSCTVPYDECAVCGNRAKSRAEYCTADKCPAGGCKEYLGKIVKAAGQLRYVFVHNDHPTFFDISHVFRPADRTAWGNKADYIQIKEAADRQEPEEAQRRAAQAMEVLLQTPPDEILARGLRRPTLCQVDWAGWDSLSKSAELLAALADQGCILPVQEFLARTGCAAWASKVAEELPQALHRLAAGQANSDPLAQAVLHAVPSCAAGKKAEAYAPEFALTRQAILRRARTRLWYDDIKFRALKKQASEDPAVAALADQYAAYATAALLRTLHTTDDVELTVKCAGWQNLVDG